MPKSGKNKYKLVGEERHPPQPPKQINFKKHENKLPGSFRYFMEVQDALKNEQVTKTVKPVKVLPTTSPKAKLEGIREGEDFATFDARLRKETDEVVSGMTVKTGIRAKRKEKLKERKLKSRLRKKKNKGEYDDGQWRDNVEFGEVIDRPPEFAVIPKAPKKQFVAPAEKPERQQLRLAPKKRRSNAPIGEQLDTSSLASARATIMKNYSLVRQKREAASTRDREKKKTKKVRKVKLSEEFLSKFD